MQNIVLTITQLNTYVKNIIDAEDLISNVSVFGEVSNFKISGNNAYFDIKEEGAQLSCVMFGAYSLNQKNGDKVLVTGKLNYSIKLGRLSFIANKVEPYGQGELYAKYIELKERLEKEGVFDERFKKSLPKFAQRIGVVTSSTGAVIRDIYNVTKRKNPYTELIVYPAKVQGVGAENEIIEGLEYFDNTDVDVVIVARGGGSFEDFSAFNNEAIVRAVFNCKKPIISGVGHETDFSLIDFVADMRAPTPSVAAELAVFDFNNEIEKIKTILNKIDNKLITCVEYEKDKMQEIINNILHFVKMAVFLRHTDLDILKNRIVHFFDNYMNNLKHEFENVSLRVSKSNPMELLKKGFTKTTKNNEVIKNINQITIGDTINTELIDGIVVSEVKQIKEKP